MSRRTVGLLGLLVLIGVIGLAGRALLADLTVSRMPDAREAAVAATDDSAGTVVDGSTSDGSSPATAAVDDDTSTGAASNVEAPPPGEGPGSPFQDDPAIIQLALEPPARDLIDLARRMGRIAGDATAIAPAPDVDYALGDTRTFWVHDIEGQEYFEVDATLQSLTDNVSVWVQEGLPVDQAALDSGADEFSDNVMPRLREIYGFEARPGIDGDDRVHVLHVDGIPGVAGYFSATDVLPIEVEPHSNRHEMFYVNHSSYRAGSQAYLSLLAHELQHMIHHSHDADEPVWVNEGLSELGAMIVGYGNQNGGAFFSTPDTGLTQWSAAVSSNTGHYAAAYAFFAYVRARYGDDVLREVVAASANGPSGIEAALRAIGQPLDFDALFLDWVVANVVHDNGRADDVYSYGEHAVDRVIPRELDMAGTFDSVNQYGTDYYDVTGLVDDDSLVVRFEGAPGVGLLSPVAEDTGHVWWSNAGDGMNSRLTRTFDLTDVDEADLRFRMWHALEPNWDYGYVSVSADNGATWSQLATSTSTDDDPNGNNLGHGFTGGSGGWVDESLDLSPYAGSEVTVRFEVVSDDAVSMSGLAIDDVRLEATAFDDDADEDRGWVSEGWLRIDPLLPQRWGVQLIVDSADGVVAHPVAVDADGLAVFDLRDIPGDATVTLAVSAMTPATRNPGTYSVAFGALDV